MVEEAGRIPWQPIGSLNDAQAPKNGSFASVEALRASWKDFLGGLTETDRREIRHRSLRRLAVETGIIERLYEIDWGLTLSLVAEGFAREVVERAQGRIDDQTLATLRAQRESLEMVLDFVRDERKLSSSFIKELHAALTRTQYDHEVVDSLGRVDRRRLVHGEYKTQPNYVRLEDGAICECAPPEQVHSEMDRLLELYEALDARGAAVHPLVKAAWLHHRFVQIHPFADGNGRVARALTLLVLEKHEYAPLVVDRFHREQYMVAIQKASAGDLSPLIALFTRLEGAALANELERPHGPDARPSGAAAMDVAHTLAEQLAALRRRKASDRDNALRARAIAIAGKIEHWFQRREESLSATFLEQGLKDVEVRRYASREGQARWFRRSIIESARTSGHFADFTDTAKWWQMRIRLRNEGLQLSFVTSLHGAGRDSGVMAVTTCAELNRLDDDGHVTAQRGDEVYVATTNDAFRFAYAENIDSLDKRGPELEAELDEGLSVALARLLKDL